MKRYLRLVDVLLFILAGLWMGLAVTDYQTANYGSLAGDLIMSAISLLVAILPGGEPNE